MMAAGKRKGKDNGKLPLLRPIICICNDLYASSLVRLRPVSKIVRFQRASDVLMIKRLREICTVEDLKIDAHALGMLTRVAQGDIRACLNALQVHLEINQNPSGAEFANALVHQLPH